MKIVLALLREAGRVRFEWLCNIECCSWSVSLDVNLRKWEAQSNQLHGQIAVTRLHRPTLVRTLVMHLDSEAIANQNSPCVGEIDGFSMHDVL